MDDGAATDPPFWSDGFDMDLPTIFPEARGLLGDCADVLLWTSGHTTHGRLNHPCVWNGQGGMLAFFGFRSPARDPVFYAGASSDVRCTAWEAFRDAWPHGYRLIVERQTVWDTFALTGEFESILWDVRGWNAPWRSAAQIATDRARCLASLERAALDFQALCQSQDGRLERFGEAGR